MPLPKSVSPQRQAANLGVLGLGEADMAALDSLDSAGTIVLTGWDPVTTDPV